MVTITWEESKSLPNYKIYYGLYYSENGGNSWIVLTLGLEKTSYSWDVSQLTNGSNYLVMLRAYDGNGVFVLVVSGRFTIENVEITTEETTKKSAPFADFSVLWFAFMLCVISFSRIKERKDKNRK